MRFAAGPGLSPTDTRSHAWHENQNMHERGLSVPPCACSVVQRVCARSCVLCQLSHWVSHTRLCRGRGRTHHVRHAGHKLLKPEMRTAYERIIADYVLQHEGWIRPHVEVHFGVALILWLSHTSIVSPLCVCRACPALACTRPFYCFSLRFSCLLHARRASLRRAGGERHDCLRTHATCLRRRVG